jgi:hypothetical protein
MKSDITIVFEGNFVDANYVKSILEKNGISSLLKENLKGQLYPMYVTYGWIKPVKIFVEKKNELKAKDTIDKYFTT